MVKAALESLAEKVSLRGTDSQALKDGKSQPVKMGEKKQRGDSKCKGPREDALGLTEQRKGVHCDWDELGVRSRRMLEATVRSMTSLWVGKEPLQGFEQGSGMI